MSRILYVVICLALFPGCEIGFQWAGRVVEMEVTAYCPCESCCGWTRDRRGRPVYAYGKSKGKPKTIGRCADGTMAQRGTVAADTRYYPFGTNMYVPGYGKSVVRDRGGAIKGVNRIDIYFDTHEQALQWGRRTLDVTVLPAPVTTTILTM